MISYHKNSHWIISDVVVMDGIHQHCPTRHNMIKARYIYAYFVLSGDCYVYSGEDIAYLAGFDFGESQFKPLVIRWNIHNKTYFSGVWLNKGIHPYRNYDVVLGCVGDLWGP
jgi:hypothetical protein